MSLACMCCMLLLERCAVLVTLLSLTVQWLWAVINSSVMFCWTHVALFQKCYAVLITLQCLLLAVQLLWLAHCALLVCLTWQSIGLEIREQKWACWSLVPLFLECYTMLIRLHCLLPFHHYKEHTQLCGTETSLLMQYCFPYHEGITLVHSHVAYMVSWLETRYAILASKHGSFSANLFTWSEELFSFALNMAKASLSSQLSWWLSQHKSLSACATRLTSWIHVLLKSSHGLDTACAKMPCYFCLASTQPARCQWISRPKAPKE